MINSPSVKPVKFIHDTTGSIFFLCSSISILEITNITCKMAPAPIPKNMAPQIGEKIKPPNHVPKMAGAPAIVPNKTKELNFGLLFNSVSLLCDSASAICVAKNPVLHSKTKHIDVRFHFRRDHYEKGDIDLCHVDTHRQLADILTNRLD